MISSSFRCSALESRFCEFWIRNTTKNVTRFVPVLAMSCQLSENLMGGPKTIQSTVTPTAVIKAQGEPTACAADLAKCPNQSDADRGCVRELCAISVGCVGAPAVFCAGRLMSFRTPVRNTLGLPEA